jgi:hypothetical protein
LNAGPVAHVDVVMTSPNRLDYRSPARELSGMTRTTSWLKYLAVAALVMGGAAPLAADPTDDAMGKLRTSADCSNKTSPHKIWCAAADWSKGKPHTLKPGLWIGFSVSVEAGADADLATALDDDAALVLLRVDKDGPQLSAQLKEVEGSPGVDTKQVDATAAAVKAALGGKGTVKLSGGIKTLADGMKGRGTRAMTRGKTGWTWTTDDNSSAELREVGKTFVVVQAPDGGNPGRTVTILTNRVK